MQSLFERVGTAILKGFEGVGGTICLLGRGLYWSKASIQDHSRIIHQMDVAGVGSLPVVCLVATFSGMVLSLQTGLELSRFHVEEMVGSLVAVSMVREMGPVISAIIVAGRVGSAMAAELGTMKVSEEIDALESMSINPMRFLVMPRLVALILMLPILTVFGILIGIAGGAVIANNIMDVGYETFFENGINFLRYKDISSGMTKSIVFAVLIACISCYQGMNTTGGAEGVGKATIRAVVLSFLFVLIFDLFITRFFY